MNDPATILVVDDSDLVLGMVSHALKGHGYGYLVAETGKAALESVDSNEIDIVILDLTLPDLPGTEVLRRIKARQPEIEVIIHTGHASVSSAAEAVERGAFAYVEKPATPDLIIGFVRRALDKRRLALDNARLSEKLKSANERLEAKVAERTAALAKASEDLESLERLKAAFIDVTSHELRTPLSVMKTIVAIIERRTSSTDPDLARITNLASRTLDRLTTLSTRIAGFARMDQLELTPTTPGELVRYAVEDLAAHIESRRQNLTIDAPEGLPALSVDRDKIRDVLLNLLMNAIRFTPDRGSVRLVVRAVDDEWLEFRVSDTGIGISEEDKPHLFDEFFTSMESLRHSSGESEFATRGIGLGLAIVKKYVEMHGGRVGFDNERSGGSAFWFTLPLGTSRAACAKRS